MAAPKFAIVTQLFIDGAWLDISVDVRQSDGVQISRGRPDEASSADPSTCTLTLNNRLGKYSPRNPTGPYYGKIGRNTPIRVLANGIVRFTGEVSSWPQRWDKTGRDVYVPVQAYGVMRRLGQGVAPLRSVMYRGVTALDTVVAYWPCEDGEDATEFASALPDHPAMTPRAAVEMASFDGFKCSEPLPKASGTRWIGSVPAYTVTGETQINFLLAVPDFGTTVSETLCAINTTGTAARWVVDVTPAGSLVLRAYDSEGVLLFSSGTVFNVNGRLMRVTVELEQVGAHVDWQVWTLEVGQLVADAAGSGTLMNRTVGRVTRIGMNVAGAQLDETVFGHIVVKNALGPADSLAGLELRAYDGEWAARRIQRICAEEGITLTTGGALQDTVSMGPQLPGALLDLLAEAAAADMGILFEARDTGGLYYRTRASMYAVNPVVTLHYPDRTVFGIEPVEDDDGIRNDITVTRVNGSSARAQLQLGPLSVNAPPAGIGRYDDEVTVSVERDEDLVNQASWRLHMGTVDEARYPVIGMNLAAPAYTADPVLTAAAQDLDVGDRIVITDAPVLSTTPEDIEQIAQGFTESLGQYEWLIDVNCTPAKPLNVGKYDATSGPGEARYSSNGTTLGGDVPASESALVLNGVSPGRASTPDAAALDIVGDLDVRVHVAMDDWTPATTQTLLSKSTATGNQRSWQFNVNTGGGLVLVWSANGTATMTATSTAGVAAANGTARWVRATLDVDNGAAGRTVTFYTSTDGENWTQLGAPVTTATVTSIFNSTAPVVVGAIDVGVTNRLAGKVHAVEIRNGINSTVVARPEFGAQPAGTTSFVDSTGKTWTVTAPASIQAVANTLFPDALLVLTPSGPPWSGSAVPFDIIVYGERMTVTAVSGVSFGQVFTVTRSVNGVVKSHATGAVVELFKPSVYAL